MRRRQRLYSTAHENLASENVDKRKCLLPSLYDRFATKMRGRTDPERNEVKCYDKARDAPCVKLTDLQLIPSL